MPILDWLTRDDDFRAADRVPYRLLEDVPELGRGDGTEGLLVQGDNLEALKTLLPFYAGRVKCIYIDPPYNTRSAFEHYDDSLEHAKWLAMMVPRLTLLREFLSEDGSIWVSIDDNEGHYLKVIMDEVFGRRNFVANVIWQKKYAPANDTLWLSESHDHIHVYAKDKNAWRPKQLPRSEKSLSVYKNPDDDPRGRWRADNYTCAKNADERPNLYYPIINPHTGQEVWPKRTRVWGYGPETHKEHIRDGLIYWGKDGTAKVPSLKRFLSSLKNNGIKAQTLWTWEEAGHNQDGRKHQLDLLDEEPFSTPKPERLIQRILHIATNPGDLVLDSFLGSGTTAAVAHKMGRRWIGVEMGGHARTHCALRLEKVVEGEQGGISKDVGWEGGGGFRFATLGTAVFDENGQINPDVHFGDLARHVWFSETRAPLATGPAGTVIGVHEGRAIALLYNGILKDRSAGGGNVLTHAVLKLIRADLSDHTGPLTVYGAACRLSETTLKAEGITFKQTPYDISARV